MATAVLAQKYNFKTGEVRFSLYSESIHTLSIRVNADEIWSQVAEVKDKRGFEAAIKKLAYFPDVRKIVDRGLVQDPELIKAVHDYRLATGCE